MTEDPEHEKGETPEDELLEQARERYKLAVKAEEKQRIREDEDLRFQVPELQWRDEDRQLRERQGTIPARPCISISLLDQPMQLILNQMRQADLGVEIHPISVDAEQDTAEAIQGLYRHIERKSRAELVRHWAFSRAVACGRGAYRILTEYDEEGGDPSDQKIVIRRILRQEGVFFDPTAQEPDCSDGNFAFVCTWLTKEEFERKYPKSKAELSSSIWLEGMRAQAPDWVDKDDVLVAEYWYKKHETKKFKVKFDDGIQERERDEVSVYRALVCGWELIEDPIKWPGRWIPLVPVVGRELQPFDEERRFVGLIGPAKDGQRFYNASASAFVQRMLSEPNTPWLAPAPVIEGFEEEYRQANIRSLPVLHYNVVRDASGQPLPPPQRVEINLQGASLAAQGMQIAQGFVQSTTALFDPSLGQLPEKDRSGRAIMALQSQADAGTGHFLSNLVDISITYEAKVILDLIPKIYDRPGRITRILEGDERKAKPVMLNAPFRIDPNTKRPVRYMPPPPPMPPQPGLLRRIMPGMVPPSPQVAPGMAQQPQVARPSDVKEYNLATGVYGVAVKVGKSYQTRLQEGQEKIGEFLGKEPQLFTALGDIFLNYQDFPGARDMAKRMVKVRDNTMPFLRDDAEGGPGPDQLKAQLQGLQQQMQMQGQALQQAVQVIQSKQAEQAAKIQVAEIQANATLMKAQADNETKLAIAGLEARFMGMMTQVKLELEHRNKVADQFHAANQQDKQQAHEVVLGAVEGERAKDQQRHEVAMSQITEPGPEPPEAPEPTQMPVGKGEGE